MMMEKISHAICEYWEYFKGRATHFKLARLLIYVSATILLGPIWHPFLEAFLETFANIKINQTPPIYGLYLAILASSLFTIVEIFGPNTKDINANNSDDRQREADLTILTKMNSLCSFEDTEAIADNLQTIDGYFFNQKRKLEGLIHYSNQPGIKFRSPIVDQAFIEFSTAINELLGFLRTNFELYNSDEFYALYPEGNLDREGPTPEQDSRYSRLQSELDDKVGRLRILHRKFVEVATDSQF